VDLNHLYIRVRDVDRSAAFYRSFYGFDGPSDWQGETFVIRNGAGFALALTPDPDPPAWPEGLHYGFLLDSVDEAREVHARLAAAGVPITEACFEPAFAVFKCLDPDGYVVDVEAGVPTARPP
jgi:catechol 2,3-dioxygenase-like lactoylglutathione lyase family enzyme